MRRILFAGSVLAGSFVALPGARADVFNLPIGLVATFSDGTALTGEFSLNIYGFVNGGGIIDSVIGHALDDTTVIQPYEFAGTFNTFSATPGGPPIGISAGVDGYTLTLTFEHSLGTPGVDPFVLDGGYAITPNSGECYSWGCSNFGNVANLALERVVTSGYAMVPEPASAALLGTALLGFLAARRRRA